MNLSELGKIYDLTTFRDIEKWENDDPIKFSGVVKFKINSIERLESKIDLTFDNPEKDLLESNLKTYRTNRFGNIDIDNDNNNDFFGCKFGSAYEGNFHLKYSIKSENLPIFIDGKWEGLESFKLNFYKYLTEEIFKLKTNSSYNFKGVDYSLDIIKFLKKERNYGTNYNALCSYCIASISEKIEPISFTGELKRIWDIEPENRKLLVGRLYRQEILTSETELKETFKDMSYKILQRLIEPNMTRGGKSNRIDRVEFINAFFVTPSGEKIKRNTKSSWIKNEYYSFLKDKMGRDEQIFKIHLVDINDLIYVKSLLDNNETERLREIIKSKGENIKEIYWKGQTSNAFYR